MTEEEAEMLGHEAAEDLDATDAPEAKRLARLTHAHMLRSADYSFHEAYLLAKREIRRDALDELHQITRLYFDPDDPIRRALQLLLTLLKD